MKGELVIMNPTVEVAASASKEGVVTLKNLIPKLGEAIGKGGKKIINAILNANLLSLVKFGVVLGVSAATVALIFKFLRDKRKSYHNEENKSMVDRALEVNYADARNQSALHPLMKNVRKNLKKGTRTRSKKFSKAVKKNKRKYLEFLEDLSLSEQKQRARRNLDLLDQEIWEDEHRDHSYHGCDLRRVWKNA